MDDILSVIQVLSAGIFLGAFLILILLPKPENASDEAKKTAGTALSALFYTIGIFVVSTVAHLIF